MGGFKNWLLGIQERESEDDGFMPDPPPGPQELLDAERRCGHIKFVQSCREFFDRRGFLSAKQRDALRYAGTPNRKMRYFTGDDPIY